jgi:UDP-2,3-diacylglucosamine pyrophosphatase LpxH
VICGHIHHAVIRDDFGVTYLNCGDWVESCTAIAEHADGRFEIITWTTLSAEAAEVEEEREAEAANAA